MNIKRTGARGGGITRALRLLTIAVIVVPVVLFATAAWINYVGAFREARERVIRATDAIHEYALKAFETDELILDRIAEHVSGTDRSELIGSEEFHGYLRQFEGKPQISSAGLIVPGLGLAASNPVFPMPAVAIEPPDYLRVDRGEREPIYIGTAIAGSFTQAPQFSVVRVDRASAQKDGEGLVFVSAKLSDFVGYYRTIVDLEDYLVTLVRSDGAVLARSPGDHLVGKVLSPSSHLRQAMTRRPKSGGYEGASELDGVERLFSYRELESYPVYVSVGLKRSAVIASWAWLMAGHLAFGVPATISLFLLSWLALRRSTSADSALAAMHEHADRREIAEASLRHIQKMDVVGQLTGGIAHDFNNLLAVISGNIELILRKPEDSGRVARVSKAALQAAERGQHLIEQLLMFSRRQVMRPVTLNLNRVLLEFETLMRHAAGPPAELQLKLDPALDTSNVDRAQFEAAVLNLVVNARDALPRGGRIIIETANVDIDESYTKLNPGAVPGAYAMVALSDNGVGIGAAVLPHVFEPFFTTKEVGKGSGLGLSQVYGFAKESGGHISIYSEIGSGTTVKLYLPKSVGAYQESDKLSVTLTDMTSGGETVLVVDDDEMVLRTAAETVADLGYHVLSAHNGGEALQILKGSHEIDLLFSDIGKPYRRDQLAANLREIINGEAAQNSAQ